MQYYRALCVSYVGSKERDSISWRVSPPDYAVAALISYPGWNKSSLFAHKGLEMGDRKDANPYHTEGDKGDRKGPHPAQPIPRPYNERF